MNPLVSLVALVAGLAAGRRPAAADAGGGAGGDAPPVRAVADGAVALGLVGLTAFLALLGVVVGCCAVGLAVLLFL